MKKREILIALMAGLVGGALSSSLKSAFATGTTHYERIISAGKMVLVDKDGTARLGASVGDDGRVTLAISDKKGRVRIGFGVLQDGSPSLDFYDASNKARMVLGLKNESPFLVFNDDNEIHRVLLRQSPQGSPHLDFNDPKGKLQCTLGDVVLAFFDEGKKVTWRAPR